MLCPGGVHGDADELAGHTGHDVVCADRCILDHSTGELYPSYGVVTPVVLTAKSPA